MKNAMIFTMLMAICSLSAFGQEALVITSKGYFPIHDGVPSSTPIPTISDVRNGAAPSDPTPPPVVPTPDTPVTTIPNFTPIDVPNLSAAENKDINELLEVAQKINDPKAAQQLATVYSYVTGLLKKDKITNENAWGNGAGAGFVPEASTEALKIMGANDKQWQAFRDVVSKQANVRSVAKTLDKAGSMRYFAIVQRALEVSFKDIPPADLKFNTEVYQACADVAAKFAKPNVGAK